MSLTTKVEYTFKRDFSLKPLTIVMGNIIKEKIGDGTFGEVYRAKDSNNNNVAIKVMRKEHLDDLQENRGFNDIHKLVQNEIKVHSKLLHPNIISIYGGSINNNAYMMVMEYAVADVWTDMTSKLFFDSRYIKHYILQLSKAVEYLHKSFIMHRDIKLENLLLVNATTMKLTDFGICTTFERGQVFYERYGTPYYMSPEVVLNKGYNEKIDCWAIGVIIYEMVYSRPPFTGDIMKNVKNLKWERCKSMSVELRNLLEHIFTIDFVVRYSARRIKCSEWLKIEN